MSDEYALLAGIAAAPADPLRRLVYADWLDDHDDPVRAELVRLEQHLAAGGGTAGDRDWFRALVAARDPAWVAKIVRPEVGRCGLRFRFACPKRWADMTPTTDPTQRHCDGCQKPVYLCTTWADATGRAGNGDCVAVDRRLVRPDALRPPAATESVTSGLIDFTYQPPPPPARLPPEDVVGVELSYTALSPAWGLVEQARADAEYGDSLSMLPNWFRGFTGRLAPGRADDRNDPFWKAACHLAGDHPDLAARVLDLDRRFDLLHWLLSATRRNEPAGPADAEIDRLFGSGSPVADHVRAGQGRPVVHVPADVVFVAADVLAGITPADLTRRFDPARADRAGIYKFVADRDDADWLATAITQLGQMQAYFAAAAGRGDEVIVVID